MKLYFKCLLVTELHFVNMAFINELFSNCDPTLSKFLGPVLYIEYYVAENMLS